MGSASCGIDLDRAPEGSPDRPQPGASPGSGPAGNGCAASDEVAEDGRVPDSDRVMFLQAFLGHRQGATADGVPVHGDSLWSAQDGFEWVDGYGNRFGLIHVDFDTLERSSKLSAEWSRGAAPRNAVV